MIKGVIFFLLIFLIANISASCNSTQIDINSASAEELDKIINVGPATAEKIIANRTYDSVDDLIRVKGIGNVTLAEIKAQGLACVDNNEYQETTPSEDETENETEDNPINDSAIEEGNVENGTEDLTETTENLVDKTTPKTEKISNPSVKKVNLTPISLNTKNIKSEDNKEILKRNLSFYGLITICLMFGALILLKNRKRKNEFN